MRSRPNTTGFDNVASGTAAPCSEHDRPREPRDRRAALFANTAGTDNDATGIGALFANTGSNNVATGSDALRTTPPQRQHRDRVQRPAEQHRPRNLALGSGAGKNLTTGSDNVDIANPGKAGESGTIRIGNGAKQTARSSPGSAASRSPAR